MGKVLQSSNLRAIFMVMYSEKPKRKWPRIAYERGTKDQWVFKGTHSVLGCYENSNTCGCVTHIWHTILLAGGSETSWHWPPVSLPGLITAPGRSRWEATRATGTRKWAEAPQLDLQRLTLPGTNPVQTPHLLPENSTGRLYLLKVSLPKNPHTGDRGQARSYSVHWPQAWCFRASGPHPGVKRSSGFAPSLPQVHETGLNTASKDVSSLTGWYY